MLPTTTSEALTHIVNWWPGIESRKIVLSYDIFGSCEILISLFVQLRGSKFLETRNEIAFCWYGLLSIALKTQICMKLDTWKINKKFFFIIYSYFFSDSLNYLEFNSSVYSFVRCTFLLIMMFLTHISGNNLYTYMHVKTHTRTRKIQNLLNKMCPKVPHSILLRD